MADRDVGGIVGHLRLDKSDWDVALSQAQGKAAELSKTNPNIRVTATTGEALAQLEAVAVAAGRLQDAQGKVSVSQSKLNDLESSGNASATKLLTARNALAKATRDEETAQIRLASAYQMVDDKALKAAADAKQVGDSANKSNTQISPLLLAAAALGPGIVPVGAAAIAAAGALGGMGAAGLLAFTGIKTAMTQGTDLGQQYMIVLGDLKSNYQQLGQTAAGNFLGSVQQSMSALDAQMPTLNAEIGQFATMAGRIGGNVFTGVIAGLQTMQPLFLQFGTYLDQLALKFAAWAQGGGFQKFVDYTMANLPNVEATLNALVAAIGRLAIGFVPLGGVAVNALRLVSDLINALPINVVKGLVTAITAGYLAFQAWTAISTVESAIKKVTTALIAFDTQQLISAGATKAAAAEQATLGSGLTGMAQKYSALAGTIGLVAIGVAAALVVDHAIASSFKETAASAEVAGAALAKYASTGQLASSQMSALGASGENLGQILSETFKQSTMDKIENISSSFAPWSTNSEKASNAIESLDTGLTQLQKTDPIAASKAFTSIAAEAAKLGISLSTLQSKLPGYTSLVGDMSVKVQIAALGMSLLSDQSGVTADSMNAIANQFSLTTQQASKYANLVGLSADDLANGVITNQQYATAVYSVAQAYGTATATGNTFLGALATFDASAGTAADKAKLIGAYLVNAQGDMLSFSGAVAGGNDAVKQMAISFQQNTKDVVDGVKAFRDTELAAIDLKTGLINLNSTGAVPLIQQLDAMQTAAEKAAEAMYQHEVGSMGAGKAAADAADIFRNDTSTTLVNNAKQLGLTTDQAQKLADRYFSMPKTVTTDVQSIGLNDVNTTLIGIGQQLSALTGKPWTIGVNFAVDAASLGQSVHDAVNNIGPVATQHTSYQHAAGGYLNEGWNTAGEGTATELMYKQGPTVRVLTHQQSMPMLSGNAGVPMLASPAGSSSGAGQSTSPPILITVQSILDGKIVAQSVTEHQMYNNTRR